jgi:hypothetical protein
MLTDSAVAQPKPSILYNGSQHNCASFLMCSIKALIFGYITTGVVASLDFAKIKLKSATEKFCGSLLF